MQVVGDILQGEERVSDGLAHKVQVLVMLTVQVLKDVPVRLDVLAQYLQDMVVPRATEQGTQLRQREAAQRAFDVGLQLAQQVSEGDLVHDRGQGFAQHGVAEQWSTMCRGGLS